MKKQENQRNSVRKIEISLLLLLYIKWKHISYLRVCCNVPSLKNVVHRKEEKGGRRQLAGLVQEPVPFCGIVTSAAHIEGYRERQRELLAVYIERLYSYLLSFFLSMYHAAQQTTQQRRKTVNAICAVCPCLFGLPLAFGLDLCLARWRNACVVVCVCTMRQSTHHLLPLFGRPKRNWNCYPIEN